jgi:SAM-dependent methyltransferase
MLWDTVRVRAFRTVLERHAPGNTLVEIGCGHGVLACLAVRAGARRVYAIEETSMIDVAREIARANGMGDRIAFLEGNSLDVEIGERADVVYGDLMGPDPLGAGMLVYAHDAAGRLLRPGGVLIPSRLTLCAVGLDSRRVAREALTVRRWLRQAEELGTAFDLDVSPLVDASRAAFERAYEVFAYKELLDPAPDSKADRDRIVTREARILDVDLRRTPPDRRVETLLSLEVDSAGTLNAIATYATVHLDDDCLLSTSPRSAERPASWGGQFISTLDPIQVQPGAAIEVEATVTPWASPAVSYRLACDSDSDRRDPLFGG